MYPPKNIIILGSGVSALTTAISILSKYQSNYTITILADKFSPDTTSDLCGGFWFPYAANPVEKVSRWAMETLPMLFNIIQEKPSLGRATECFLYYTQRPKDEDISWRDKVPQSRELDASELPDGATFGISFLSVVMVSYRYMRYLMDEAERLGARFQRYTVTSVDRLMEDFCDADLIVNCLGLGSAEVFKDPEIVPGRGVIVRAKEKVGKQFLRVAGWDDHPDGLTYIISRDDCCILGGTYGEGDYSLEYCEDEVASIIKRTSTIAPLELENTDTVWVGQRPVRKWLRLEMDNGYEKPIIHNYGHGGCGLTIHWGCAFEVNNLVEKHCPSYQISPKL